MNEVLAITVQQEKDVPVTITVPKPEGSQALDLSDSPACQTELHLFQCLPFWISPLLALPQGGHPFTGFIASPMQKKWDHSSSGTLGDQCDKQTCVNSHCYRRLDPALNHKGRNLPAPVPVQTRPLLILKTVLKWEPRGVPGIMRVKAKLTRVGPHPTWIHPEGMWLTPTWSQPPGTVSHVWTQMRVTIRTAHKKYRMRAWASCSLGKSSLSSEAQLKWIGDSHRP